MKDPAIRSNRMQCFFALIGAAVVAVCVIIGVTMNLVTLYDENFDHMGIRTFCMFTVNSNILAGLSMMLCLPYTIDGLRTGNYHLPDWVVVLMHITVTAVALTFLVSLFILAPVKGFVLIFTGSRFFLHGVCPVLSIVTYCCFINSHIIRIKEAWLGMIPVLVYAVVYIVMVGGLLRFRHAGPALGVRRRDPAGGLRHRPAFKNGAQRLLPPPAREGRRTVPSGLRRSGSEEGDRRDGPLAEERA